MPDPQAILGRSHALHSAGQIQLKPPLDRHTSDLAARGHWLLPRRLDSGPRIVLRCVENWPAGGDPPRDGAGMAIA